MSTPAQSRPGRPAGSRRGASVAVVVLMLSVVMLAVIGAVAASGEEAQVGAMRAETARAFYAAESGARVMVKCSTSGQPMPTGGSTLTLGSATCTYVSVPQLGEAGDAFVQGADGTSARRLKVTLSGY